MINSGKEWDWMDAKVNMREYYNIVKAIESSDTHEKVFSILQWISSYEKLNGKTVADKLREIAVKQIKSI